MTFEEAKRIATGYRDDLDTASDYKTGYVFSARKDADSDGGNAAIAIHKESGDAINIPELVARRGGEYVCALDFETGERISDDDMSAKTASSKKTYNWDKIRKNMEADKKYLEKHPKVAEALKRPYGME